MTPPLRSADDRAPSPDASHRRIDDIEALRAVAVGMVLVEHVRINLIPWVWGVREPLYRHFGFWSGVDLFLAISGFVIARSLLPDLAQARDRAELLGATLAFWTRRAFRLLPSAWLWLAVLLLGSAYFNRSGAFEPLATNVKGALAAVLNVANFRIAYLLTAHPGQPVGASFPYWSLSLEEQFYLLLPLLVFLARRRLPVVLAAVVLVQAVVAQRGPSGNHFLHLTRSDGLALGVLLAIWSAQPSYRRLEPTVLRSRAARILLPLLALVAFSWLSRGPYESKPFTASVVAALAAAIVWVASYDQSYIFPPGPLKRFLCWMGARSYAIYLIHVPAFFATRELWFRLRPSVLNPGWGHLMLLLATALPLLFAVADLNFRLVERPLRRYGAGLAERIRHRQGPAPATAPAVRVGFAAASGARLDDPTTAD